MALFKCIIFAYSLYKAVYAQTVSLSQLMSIDARLDMKFAKC